MIELKEKIIEIMELYQEHKDYYLSNKNGNKEPFDKPYFEYFRLAYHRALYVQIKKTNLGTFLIIANYNSYDLIKKNEWIENETLIINNKKMKFNNCGQSALSAK